MMLRFLVMLSSLVFFACGSNNGSEVSGEIQKTKTIKTFMPENDLWREDDVNFLSNMDEALFNKIIDIGQELYDPIAKDWNETLTITRSWTDSTVNASAWRNGTGDTEITMYGGLSRRKEVIPQGFALVLCHELNHLYGDIPYIDTELKMSAEGQADFQGANWCLHNIVKKLKDSSELEISDYMKELCLSKNDPICLEQLAAGNSLGKLLAVLGGKAPPKYETPDNTVVKKTNTSYPKTVQCRLDSYKNGTLGLDRPLCWYKP